MRRVQVKVLGAMDQAVVVLDVPAEWEDVQVTPELAEYCRLMTRLVELRVEP